MAISPGLTFGILRCARSLRLSLMGFRITTSQLSSKQVGLCDQELLLSLESTLDTMDRSIDFLLSHTPRILQFGNMFSLQWSTWCHTMKNSLQSKCYFGPQVFSDGSYVRLNVEISMFPLFLPYGIFVGTQQVGNTVKSSISSLLRSLNITIYIFDP